MASQNSPSTSKRGRDLIAMLPSLIQQDIAIHCSGDASSNIYSATVIGVDDTLLHINLPHRIAGSGYLRSSRPVVLSFVLGDGLYTCPAEYQAENSYTRELLINGEITPTTRRDYARYPLQVRAVYVPVSDYSLARGQFANLRWKKSITLDLSAGGALLETTFQVPADSYLLINLEIPGFKGPFFVFAQTRWFGLSDIRRKEYMCGVRFILGKELPLHFSDRTVSALPAIMLSFDNNLQKELDTFLEGQSGHRNQGDDNDD